MVSSMFWSGLPSTKIMSASLPGSSVPRSSWMPKKLGRITGRSQERLVGRPLLVDNQRTKLGVKLQHDVAAEREIGACQYDRAGVLHSLECPRLTAIVPEALRIRCGWLVALGQLPVGEDLQPRIGAWADVVRQHVESADRRHEAAVRVRTDYVLVRHARIVGHGTRVAEALRGGEVARVVDPHVEAGGHEVCPDRDAERVRRIAHRGLDFSRRTHVRLQVIVVESAHPRHLERHLSHD